MKVVLGFLLFSPIIAILILGVYLFWSNIPYTNHKKTIIRKKITERTTSSGRKQYRATAVIGIKLFWGLCPISVKYYYWCSYPDAQSSKYCSEMLPSNDNRGVGFYWFNDLDLLKSEFDKTLDRFIRDNNFREERRTWTI